MDDSKVYGQLNLNLPHDVIKLPTGGVFYKSKKKSVKVGYLTAADENILMSSDPTIKNELVMTLIRNKLFEPDLKPEELLLGDIEAILIFLRNSSFGPEYNIMLKDPNTNENFEVSIMLDELNLTNNPVKPDPNGYFEVRLPKSGYNAKIRPLSYSEQVEIDDLETKYATVGRAAPKETTRLAKMLVELNGMTDKGQIFQEIEKLPIMDSKFVKTFIAENEPKIDLFKSVIAPSGVKVDFRINFGVEFFRPFFEV